MSKPQKKNYFWKNKKIFITGHTGFKGSWLSIILKMLGANVTGYSTNPPTNPSLFKLARVSSYIDKSIIGDIRDLKKIKKKIIECNPEIVFHLAAQALVIDSYKKPIESFQTNAIGTLNVLESLRSLKKMKCAIIVTTDKVYKVGSKKKVFNEKDPIGVTDPYGSSKVCAEIITESYNKSFFFKQSYLKIATVRAGNVIGGGDYSLNRIIPDYFRALKSNKKLNIRNQKHIRPWQYVLEPLSGYMLLAEKISKNKIKNEHQSWNFAPKNKNCIPVKELIDLIQKYSQKKVGLIYNKSKPRLKETTYLKLSSKKASRSINWNPKLNMNLTVKKICEWYETTNKTKNYLKISEKHIKEFFMENYEL